jgi:hypothetical protein
MAVLMHHAPQFKKCLEKLRRAGGRAALAAAQVEEILATLARYDGIPPEQVHNRDSTYDWDWDYDEILLQQIDEKMLRRIFRGLYGA